MLFGYAQHLLVKQIRFRIFAEKCPPRPASKKPLDVGTIGEFVVDGMEVVARSGGQSPFHHFGV